MAVVSPSASGLVAIIISETPLGDISILSTSSLILIEEKERPFKGEIAP